MRPSCYALFSTVRKFCTINYNARKPKNVNISNKVTWNEKQLEIIEAVKRGKSVFITGSAGTGKTMLIEHLIELLVKNHGINTVYVMAPTHIAACAVRGQTLYSFAGVGLAEADAQTLVSTVKGNDRACNRWKQAKALVIDEINMVDKNLFDKFEYIGRKVRCESGNDNKPWGGIQLVVCGDFFQLPPDNAKFAFEADYWELSFQLFVQLETVFRQSNSEHVKLLEGIRVGVIDGKSLEFLQQRCCKEEPPR
ncbi:ATP-dependent DNA helicase pfh1-like [Silene latifolia]|uniref:ATP-dependent DNA helicase pfh1-like n=1 Tax=Silene latifolia TaxID=37657 RepID=UPI003D787BCA